MRTMKINEFALLWRAFIGSESIDGEYTHDELHFDGYVAYM